MNKYIQNTVRRFALVGMGALATVLTACNPEPDESDLYTFTGETIESFIRQDSSLTSFNYILARVGYDKMMAAYGTYTCFAPVNAGVIAYCDSLYDDETAKIPHNGMSERSVEGLSDSLCLAIVRYHLLNSIKTSTSLTTEPTQRPLLGYTFTVGSDSLGRPLLANKATIIDLDNEVTNGVVHIIDSVIPRDTRPIGDVLDHQPGFTIFNEAFHRTGLVDSVNTDRKIHLVNGEEADYTFSEVNHPSRKARMIGPKECKVGYTIFAESDETLAREGIHSFSDLVRKANEIYANAPDWYDYLKENNLTVSTGDDYTSRTNALNMFVAYHILYAQMRQNELLFEKNSISTSIATSYWNYGDNADVYDYYETMLPHTIMKIWSPRSTWTNSMQGPLFINRYQTNNTLTNELVTADGYASMGTNHVLVDPGVLITRRDIESFNTYVHPIEGLIKYDRTVARGVLNERMRFDATTLLPELITNGLRFISDPMAANMPEYGNRGYVGIATDYFDNVEIYSDQTIFCYNTHSANRCYQSDQMQMYGQFDFAVKLPPVPSGTYELRVCAPPLSYGGMSQYYIGTSRNVQSMEALGIPFDLTISGTDPRIGWTDYTEEDDMGIASDAAMRNRGYMRAPYSFCGHAELGWQGKYDFETGTWTENHNCRAEGGDGTMIIRRILGTVTLRQGTENWLRMKAAKEGNQWLNMFDFIELVPISVVNNQEFIEDWF